ncbi:hypothetical protein D3C71_1223400 [compost metagenome]
MFGDGAFDGLQRDGAVGFVGLYFDQIGGRIEAVESDLRFHRMPIRREGAGLHEDDGALGGGPVEADHHQVQVDAEGVHRHDFAGQGADHAGELFAHQAVVVQPLGVAGEVAFDGQRGPFIHDFLDGGTCAARLQTQRVADEVGLVAVVVLGEDEFVAQGAQRVGGVQGNGMGAAEEFGHGATGGVSEPTVYPGGGGVG